MVLDGALNGEMNDLLKNDLTIMEGEIGTLVSRIPITVIKKIYNTTEAFFWLT